MRTSARVSSCRLSLLLSCLLFGLAATAVLVAPLGCQTAASKKAAEVAADPVAMIGRLEQERAPPAAFASFLASEDATLRRRAVIALARLEHTAALPLLSQALADASAGVRAAAAFGLGQLDLAFDPKVAAHETARDDVERALVAALAAEKDGAVRQALVRALGRISDSTGLDALVALAGASPAGGVDLRTEAFTALGVSGARRQASRANDAALASAAARALVEGNDAVRVGAAYAAFRQKLRLPVDAVKAGLASADPQTRIFLVRAASSQDEPVAELIVDAGLNDADWRARVEALRVAGGRSDAVTAVTAVVEDSAARLAAGEGGAGGEGAALGHVVREGCLALARTGAGPAQARPALQKALVTLAATVEHRAAACACAVALDVVDPGAKAIERCDVDADDAKIDRLRVEVAAASRMPSSERVAELGRLLGRDDRKVRMAAAAALVEDGSAPAAGVAAARLAVEEDWGVTSTLLELFVEDEENAAQLTDSTLYKLGERFRAGTSFEQVEPLVTVVRIAHERQTPTARTILTELAEHPEPRVRDAVAQVPAGERAPGPRATVLAAPSLDRLPAWALVRTTRGDIRIAFDREHAPATVAHFVALAKASFYDGTPFHRVIADFVAQGGDKRGDGAGGPGYTIACENSDEGFTRGAVGMATAGKDTGGSQFFFTHSFQPHLDGRYTLFARVVDGLEVMDAIQPDDVVKSVDFLLAAPLR